MIRDELLAHRLWDLLVEHGEADPRLRDNFVRAQLEGCREYHFGPYGFKLWNDRGHLYVSYYHECQSPANDALRAKLNRLLQPINQENNDAESSTR